MTVAPLQPLESRITSEQSFRCDEQGRLFELALAHGYAMRDFTAAFMNSRAAEGLDSDFDRYQWAGNPYILEDVAARHALSAPSVAPNPTEYDREACFWMGYTYRWWNFYTGESSRDIYAQADYDQMHRAYPGFHTLACSLAIDRLRSPNQSNNHHPIDESKNLSNPITQFDRAENNNSISQYSQYNRKSKNRKSKISLTQSLNSVVLKKQ